MCGGARALPCPEYAAWLVLPGRRASQLLVAPSHRQVPAACMGAGPSAREWGRVPV